MSNKKTSFQKEHIIYTKKKKKKLKTDIGKYLHTIRFVLRIKCIRDMIL